jgi:hypothetical protein
MARASLLVSLAVLTTSGAMGCATGYWTGLGELLAGASRASTNHKIMLFGGPGHKTYLGCLSCSEYASESVLNQYGRYGSAYQSESIFNRFGSFGSRYSQYSPCNPYASDPPVIVDENGQYYGRLTVNAYRSDAAKGNVLAWIRAVCENDS